MLYSVKTLTKETLELELANAISNYHHDQQGKAPGRIRVLVVGNLITALTSDVFTAAEEELHLTAEGRKLIKSARRDLRSLTRDTAHAMISRVVGCPVLRSYWDLDVRVGEQMEAYVLSEDIESRLP
jgi:uncharacterized protein YbcI